MAQQRVTQEVRDEVAEMHKAGMTVAEISAELELSMPTVYKTHAALDLVPNKKKRQTGPSLASLKPEQAEEFIERYEAGEVATKLLADYGLNYPQMYTLLDMMGVTPRSKRPGLKEAREKQLEHAIQLYIESGATIAEIVAETGVHQPVLHREIRLRGIPMRRPHKDSE